MWPANAFDWTSKCGVGMGCIPVSLKRNDGRQVLVVGRGGGHAPPEKPDGISMVDATNGATLWTLPLKGFMSTMTFNLHKDSVLVFDGGEHLWVDATRGKVTRQVSIASDIPSRVRESGEYVDQKQSFKTGNRAIIQQSNILVGDYHYFRAYKQPWLGRVNAESGKVEYLQLPTQLSRMKGQSKDELYWEPKATTGKQRPVTSWAFRPNDMKNSRGLVVMGDKRSKGSGWGHQASALPTAIGEHLYVPIMSGTVYVIRWNAISLDEKAVVAINDLGPIGPTWTRASLSYANGRLYAHTIKEVICIE